MSRLNADNERIALEIISRYPRKKSALIPLLHLAQEQDGWVTDDAMAHIAELVEVTPAEVLGTVLVLRDVQAPPSRHLPRQHLPRDISCHLLGADDLLAPRRVHARREGRRHHRRRHVHRRRCRVHRRLHRGAVPPGQLPLRQQGQPRRLRPARRRPPPRRPARHPGPRHAGQDPPAHPCRQGRRPVMGRGRRPAGLARIATRVASERSRRSPPAASMSPTGTPSTATCARAATPVSSGRSRCGPNRSTKRSRPPRCWVAAAPASRPASSGASCPPGVWPRYLVVNGDESEPGTYKDRLLLERDPHQLIEGCASSPATRSGLSQCFLYVRGEMAHGQERVAEALNEAYEAGYVGKNILGTELSVDVVLHWGAGAYIVGEETALIESLEGNRGMPRLKPPFFPAAIGLYGKPTIVNNVETLSNLPVDRRARRPGVRRHRWRAVHRHPNLRRVGPRQEPGRVRGRVRHHDVPRHHHGRRLRRRHPTAATPQGVHPRRRIGPVVLRRAPRPAAREGDRRPRRLDARLRRHRGDGRDHRHGEGLPQRGPVLRPRVVWQVLALPRGHQLAREDPPAHPRRQRPTRRPRPAHGRLRQHQPRHRLAAQADHHLSARPLGGVTHRVGHRPPTATSSIPHTSPSAAPRFPSRQRHERDGEVHHQRRTSTRRPPARTSSRPARTRAPTFRGSATTTA